MKSFAKLDSRDLLNGGYFSNQYRVFRFTKQIEGEIKNASL
jgi:hypothetical protein